ncbi:prepilin-type N-terminal cleavage/methylation domain-containing protein [Alcaligenaceae bacterium CGII-47]|nr:prepilin-type N-terminal cleavage/methylation domain-containing protein [Alcaligenaceae bacterium CGII-47]
MSPAIRSQQGFTLIEVLVALVLLSLLSVMSWRGLDAVDRAGSKLDARAEQVLALSRTLGQLERDILLRAGPDIVPSGILWSEHDGLSLVRSAGAGQWQQLRWYLQGDVLFRAAGTPSYRLPLPKADAGAVAVLHGVHAWAVRVWRPGQGWVNPAVAADTSGAGATPEPIATGLEISIYRNDPARGSPYLKVVVLQ